MDLMRAMELWTNQCGGTLSGWDTKDGYYTLFIKTGKVRGYTKAQGGGIHWEWPDELLKVDAQEKKKETRGTSIVRQFREEQMEEEFEQEQMMIEEEMGARE
mgnify:CR=1 FL=1|jgi:hypothetical protein|tara:strand:+ start:331 stop:636 length:306 start_codon:yes stop_codon:yes gene_type:complete